MGVKSKVIAFLIGAATVLGTVLFLVWKAFLSKRNEKDAEHFLKTAPDELQKEVLSGLRIKEDKFNEKTKKLKEEVENAKKEEIIYAFEKVFGVGSHHRANYIDTDNGTGK